MILKTTKHTFILSFFLLARVAFSQNTQAIIKKNLSLGDEAYEIADYLKAFNFYKVVLQHDTTNYEVYFKSGVCLFGMNKNDTNSIRYFKKGALKVPESHYYLGRIYQLKGLTKKTMEELYYFKTVNTQENIDNSEVNLLIRNCENTIYEENKKEKYIVRNLGDRINSKYPEYVPLIWNVNGSLIFTSRREDSKGGLKDPYGRFYEDIYISQQEQEGWKSPLPLSDDINTQSHDACVAFSPAGNELIIYRTDAKQTGGDLYISKYDGNKWETPVMLGPEINSDHLEASACFSADGDEIIFSSNRPGGFGGKDLYRVRKFMNGKYSLPFNLGPAVNTGEDEDAPFIDKRDNALYFSSKGHNSIGEYDIFKSPFNNDTHKWMKAENLGIPINSTNDDIYFMKLDDKETAFFTSRRDGGFGDADIYQINFNESSQIIIHSKINFTGLTKDDVKDIQLSMYNGLTGDLEGIFRPNKNLLSMILIANINKPYKLIMEGKSIDPIIKTVTFTENDKEFDFEVVKKLK